MSLLMSQSARPKYQCSQATITRIIEVAERLFADHGIGGVSMRRIAREAGQKNVMAARYHFDSKEGLVRSIYEKRTEEDDRRRLYYLSTLCASGLDQDLRTILAATLRPLADELDSGPSGWNYLRFQIQVRIHSAQLYREIILEGPYGEGVRLAMEMARKILPVMPEPVLSGRFDFAIELTLSAFAERARQLARGEQTSDTNLQFVSILIDSIAGMLAAPAYPTSAMNSLPTPETMV